MAGNILGLGTSNSFFDTYFGSSSNSSSTSGTTSASSSLGDFSMIKNGTYKKMMKAYYAAQDDDSTDTISGSGSTDTNNNLSTMKSAAKALNTSAKTLQNTDYDTTSREDLLDDVKSFVSDYNSALTSAKKLNSYSILQTAVWATDQIEANESLLNDVGITIKDDNSLAINEDKFNSADINDIKALFSGSNSLSSHLAQKSSTMYNQSANQMAVNSGKRTYTNYGTLS